MSKASTSKEFHRVIWRRFCIPAKPFQSGYLCKCRVFPLLWAFLLFLSSCQSPAKVEDRLLTEEWFLASSKSVGQDGAALSLHTGTDPQTWVKTRVPSTVMGALVETGKIRDPFFGKNLEEIPRADFADPWWFRTTFDLVDYSKEKETVRLLLDGINYSCNVWLNGGLVASKDSVYGAFNQFDLNISRFVTARENILAIQVFPPKPGDFYMGFVDWAPTPPDNNMGIFREVHLKRTGKVSLDHIFVVSDVDLPELKKASLTVTGEVTNYSDEEKQIEVGGKIENISFKSSFPMKAGEKKTVKFDLTINNPR